MSDVKPKITISVWKAIKFGLILLGGSLATPAQVDALLPPGIADMTVAAALAGVINYLKVKFGWKF